LQLRNKAGEYAAFAVRQVALGLFAEHDQNVYRPADGVEVPFDFPGKRVRYLTHLLHRRGVERVHYREEKRFVFVETIFVRHGCFPLS
jgi:hypothetical protein